MSVGRGVFWKKQTVDSAYQLDILPIARKLRFDQYAHGDITWTSAWGKKAKVAIMVWPGGPMRLLYKVTDRKGKEFTYNYEVILDTTPCYYGGYRWWFLCPSCQRRCRILYMPSDSRIFACRICHNLTYSSQQEASSHIGRFMDALFELPALEAKLLRTRSKRKRASLARRYLRMTEGVMQAHYFMERKRRKRGKGR